MNKKFLLFFIVISGLGLGLYGYLGGFTTAKITVTTSKTQYIAGKYYAGPIESEAFGQLFREAAENLENKKLTGHLGNIYYNNPDQKGDSIKAFIGVIVPHGNVTLPTGYELRTIAGGKKVVQATVKAHYMLAPNRLYKGLFDYVKKQKLNVREYYVEQFLEENQAIVQAEIIP